MPVLSLAVAVVASVAFGFSTVLQQSSARSTALRHTGSRRSWLPVLSLFDRLVRERAWLLGWALSGFGFLCHALALHFGAIAVVQAVLVSQLMFALLISARRHNLRPTPRDWAGAAAICAGIVTTVLLRGDVTQHDPTPRAVLLYAGIVGAAMTALVGLARRASGRRPRAQLRTALMAVASGMSFSAAAAFLVLATGSIAERGVLGLFDWPTIGVATFALVGTLLLQDAFASGSLSTAVATTTITDPICSGIVGAVLFDATPPGGWVLFVGLPLCAALVATGVVLLATSTTLHDERHLHAPLVPHAASEERPASSAETVTTQGWSAPSNPSATSAVT